MSPDRYEQASQGGVRTPGHDCENCGRPGFEHERERVYPESGPPGTWHWELRCPA